MTEVFHSGVSNTEHIGGMSVKLIHFTGYAQAPHCVGVCVLFLKSSFRFSKIEWKVQSVPMYLLSTHMIASPAINILHQTGTSVYN